MMVRSIRRFVTGRRGIVLATALVLTSPSIATAQRKGTKDFDIPDLKQPEKRKLQDFAAGKTAVADSDKELLDKAAQHFVYRLTDKSYFNPMISSPHYKNGIREIVDDAMKHLPDLSKAPPKDPTQAENQQHYVQMFGNRLAEHIGKLLNGTDEGIARVNAVILLAKIGEFGQIDLIEPMCKIVEDPNQSDAVRLFALRGLKNVFDHASDTAFRGDAGEAALKRGLNTAADFLNRKPKMAPETSEGEVEAFRYVRREAIRALGASRVTALVRRSDWLAMPAYELLRVTAGDRLTPPPNLLERVEAAIGLCRMRALALPAYQADYAAYHIAKVVRDFTDQYNRDRGGAGSPVDYQYYSYALQDALASLDAETKHRDNYVNTMIAKIKPMLRTIQTKGAADTVQLEDWLKAPPPNKELFKGKSDTAVTESAAAAPETAPAKEAAPAKAPPAKKNP